MFLARLAVNRPVLTAMMILSLVVFGAFSYTQLSQELMPDISFPFVIVTTVYPGAGPKEVASQVTEILEEEVGSVSGLKTMQSQSLENLSFVMLEFELDVDANFASIDVKDKVDLAMMRLPDEILPPVVQQYSFTSAPVLNVAIRSDRPLKEITQIAETRLKDEISRIDGVSKVEIVGGLQREINIACRADRLRSYGLSIMDVVGFIQAENVNFPAGHITGLTSEYSLRMVGEFSDLDQLRRLRVITPTGSPVFLRDIADINDYYEEPREFARFQDKPAVSIQVKKADDANSVIVSRRVREVMDDLSLWLGQERIEATIINDKAKYITDSVQDVLKNILIGILLTSILLYLFLHDARSTIVVAVTMPTAVIATFSLMYFADFTINVISLTALGISIGILVTNSIVVLENIANKIDKGYSSKEAAIKGTSEIALAVGASTLTNIVVFTPIAYMQGIIGRIFFQFGMTVVFATLISLLTSFTITPMLASILLKGKDEKTNGNVKTGIRYRFGAAWDRFYDQLALDYKNLLRKALRHRWLVVLITVLSFFGGCGLFTQVGTEFFPEGDEGIVVIIAKLPPGTSLEQTDRTMRRIAKAVANIPEVDTVLSEIGGEAKGVNEGQITLNMVDIELRDRKTPEIVEAIRPMLTEIPAAEISVSTSSGQGPGAGLQVEITGPELSEINKLVNRVMELAHQVEGVIDITSTYESGKPEISFVPDRNQMSAYGIMSVQVGSMLRAAFEGMEVSYYREGGEDYDIRVQFAKDERENISSFGDMLVRTPMGYVPLSQLGKVEFTQSETKIERKNKQRIIMVTANFSGITSGDANKALSALVDQKIGNPPPGYTIDFGGQQEMMEREFGYLFQALFLAIILTYMVLAAILEDFVHPITIMLTLPLGLVGVAIALFVSGVSINLMSLMAIIMLVGIVVNNAILILDYTRQLREKGMEKIEALIESSSTRLRPIIMTNLAIAISVAPQALGGAGAEFRKALAVVTMGGVLVSALFTLFLIPAIYSAFDRFAIKPKVLENPPED